MRKCKLCKKRRLFYSTAYSYCKSCFKSWRKAHYQENKPHTLKMVKIWKGKNPEKQLGYVKTYQKKNSKVIQMYYLMRDLMIKDGAW